MNVGKIKGSDKCPCGSGKRYKNCCKNRSQKKVTIDIDPRNLSAYDGVAFSPSGELLGIKSGELGPLIGRTEIRHYSERVSGKEKPLVRGLYDGSRVFIDPGSMLFQYENVFVVDTNTRPNFMGTNKVSVASLMHCQITPLPGDRVDFRYGMVVAWEFWNIQGNEEKFIWKTLIEALERGVFKSICQGGGAGVLTDCDIDNHSKFNSRALPIYEDFYLPDGYSLLFATSDSASSLPNELVKKCDKFSNRIFPLIKETGVLDESPDDAPYSHFREWIPHKEDRSWFIEREGVEGLET